MPKFLCKGCAQELHYYSKGGAKAVEGCCYECDRNLTGREAYLYSEKILAVCDVCGKQNLYARDQIAEKVSCMKCNAWGYLDESGEIIGSGSI